MSSLQYINTEDNHQYTVCTLSENEMKEHNYSINCIKIASLISRFTIVGTNTARGPRHVQNVQV